MNNKTKSGKLSLLTKTSYGLSEVGCQFSWTLVSSYLTLFYTDVVGLAPAVISMIMLGARIWDGINDPLMGMIADRTNTRWGKFRPYLLFCAPLLAIFNVLTFSALDLSQTGKAVYATVTYVLLGMIYTAICIAQGSLANVMTHDNNQRMQLNTFRGVAAGVASLVLSSITMPLILKFGNGDTSSATGYTMAAAILSVIAVPCLWIAFANCKEVVTSEKKEQRGSVLESAKVILRHRDFLLEVVFEILTLIALFGRFAIMSYYFIYVLRRTDLIALLCVVMSISQIVSQFFIPELTKRLSKKYCLCIANIGMAAGCLIIYMAGLGDTNLWMVFLGTGMLGFFNILSPVLYGLTAELVDDVEVKTNIRADGTGYSVFSFATKLGNAFGGSVGVLLLATTGYVAGADQTVEVQHAMNGVINLAPMALYLVGLVPLFLMKMNNKKAKENTKILVERAEEA